MSGESTSTNMGMPIPGVSVTAGPLWATDINSCLTIIDAHDHSPGYGVQIGPAGMNINADLTFNGYNATTFRSVRFTAQGSPLGLSTDKGCIYESGVDLYYNDGSGNQIRLTQSGGVAGSSGSIGSLASPASATYSAGSKTFIWQSGSTKAAAMDNGAVTIRETDVASAKGITLSSPTSLGADYSLTLPTALPGSTQYLSSTSSGSMAFASPDTIRSSMTKTASSSTATAGNVAVTNDCGTYTNATTSFTDITNLSATLTTSGRPVMIKLMITGSGYGFNTTAGNAVIRILRDAVTVGDVQIWSSFSDHYYPFFDQLDAPGAGTYVYKVQGRNTGAGTLTASKVKLVVYELT